MTVELEWNFVPVRAIPCAVAQNGDVWLIASTINPRFCFEGASEEDVIGIAKRALDFWSARSGEMRE
jgi:hypothetical protein